MVRAICYLAGVVAAACLLTLAVSGCVSPETRHEIVKIVFTGVPESDSDSGEQDRQLTPAERVEAARKAKMRANFRQPEMFVHGPRASNECEGCHTVNVGPRMFSGAPKANVPTNGSKADAPTNGSKDAAPTKRQITPKLARPLPELCITCHSDKSGKHAQELGLMVHQPVAEGMCVRCHHPHSAPRQYMLLEDPIPLCMTCHAADKKGKVPITAVHTKNPDKDCLECHNPHVGKTAQLLRADFNEWQLYEVAR